MVSDLGHSGGTRWWVVTWETAACGAGVAMSSASWSMTLSVRHLETDEGREEPARACPGAPAVAMGTHAVRSQLAAPVQGRELMSFPLCCRRW